MPLAIEKRMQKSKSTKEPEKQPEPPPSTEGMPLRLFNVMTMHEFPVLAKDHDDARAAATAVIRSGEQRPYEQVAYEVRNERDLSDRWKNEPPWVSANVEYDPPEAETCGEIFIRIYTKR